MRYKVIFGHFEKKNIYKQSCASDLNNVRTDCWPTTEATEANINAFKA